MGSGGHCQARDQREEGSEAEEERARDTGGEREPVPQRARRQVGRESRGPVDPFLRTPGCSRGNMLVSSPQPLLRGPSAQTLAPLEPALTAAPGGQGSVSHRPTPDSTRDAHQHPPSADARWLPPHGHPVSSRPPFSGAPDPAVPPPPLYPGAR